MTEICAHMCECIWMRVFCGGEEQLTVPFFYFFGHPKITIIQSFDTYTLLFKFSIKLRLRINYY